MVLPVRVLAASLQGRGPFSPPAHASSAIPTGVTPSAKTVSCEAHPMVTTRAGSAGITVEPNAWSIVTGKTPSLSATLGVGSRFADPADAPEQAAANSDMRAAAAIARQTLKVFLCPKNGTDYSSF